MIAPCRSRKTTLQINLSGPKVLSHPSHLKSSGSTLGRMVTLQISEEWPRFFTIPFHSPLSLWEGRMVRPVRSKTDIKQDIDTGPFYDTFRASTFEISHSSDILAKKMGGHL